MKYAAPNLSLYTVLGKAYSACHYAFKYNSTSSNIPAGHQSLFFCLSPLPFPVTEPTLSEGRKGERKDRGQKKISSKCPRETYQGKQLQLRRVKI